MSIRTEQNVPHNQNTRPNYRNRWILGSAAGVVAAAAFIAPHVSIGQRAPETQVCVKAQPSDGFQSVVDRAVSKEVSTKQDADLGQFGLSNPTNAQKMVDNITSGLVQPGNAYVFTFEGSAVHAVAVGDPFSQACQG